MQGVENNSWAGYSGAMSKPLTPLGLRVQALLGDHARQHLAETGIISQAALSRLTTDPSRSDRAEQLGAMARALGLHPVALLSSIAERMDGHWSTMAAQLLAIADALDVDVSELLPAPREAVVISGQSEAAPDPKAEGGEG